MGVERMKIVKRLDIIIIGILIVVSFVPYLIFKNNQKDVSEDKLHAIISVSGEVYKEIDLSPNNKEEFVVETPYGNNKVQVHDGGISIVEADCSDGVCVNQGTARKPGDMIVCLPHGVIIEVVGPKNNSDDEIISK